MDIFGSALKNEFGDDFEDLMQIIDDYLERPRRSEQPELNVIHNARKICERVEQATSDIESASQIVHKPTATQTETSHINLTLQSTKTKESPQSSQSSNSKEFHSTATAAAARTPDDDDVVYVSSEPSGGPPVVDLLSPMPIINSGIRRNRRRRAVEEVISLDDSCTEPQVPKRTNSTGTCTHVQNEFQSRNSESEGTGLKLKCAVCMDDPIKNEPTTTICGHIFCKKCIYKAIKISKKCPLCNKKINSTTQVHRVYV